MKPSERILITLRCALGDNVVLTAAVRDLKKLYPEYEIHTRTNFAALWSHNPYIESWQGTVPKGCFNIPIRYGPYIRRSATEKIHFLSSLHAILSQTLKKDVYVTEPKPDLHLTDEEKEVSLIEKPYWVFVAGGKSDFTVKIWSQDYAQRLANMLTEAGITVVQAGVATHLHPKLTNVINYLGKTTYLQFFQLIYHAEGVICPITAAMHIAAAFDKPCVVTGGGREAWWWESYVNSPYNIFGPRAEKVKVEHKYLNVQDQLDCCMGRGCWANKLSSKERDRRNRYCKYPQKDDIGNLVPKCQLMITPEMVLDAVLTYKKELII